jgi:hypothetical protein
MLEDIDQTLNVYQYAEKQRKRAVDVHGGVCGYIE